ncbi:hypothetical protein L596_006362 [Steinernema carpocapsae]|uniref:Uncharacterized protein n=1 Tax=Steinernema carpocapsae TaxID=34508 RepID=A0A4U8V1U3_STECR|nr:hypothetical protein L596_006362 [Steinernema carpocapsae]
MSYLWHYKNVRINRKTLNILDVVVAGVAINNFSFDGLLLVHLGSLRASRPGQLGEEDHVDHILDSSVLDQF